MCGIVGIVGTSEVAPALYDGLTVLQHRGQDAAGIATASGTRLRVHKGNGLVREVTTALAALHASIEELRSWTTDAPQGGGVLFEAEALVHLPAQGDPTEVREALERIAGELMVDLEVDDLP